jgi:hypothetical protein
MTTLCAELHSLVQCGKPHEFPFDPADLPLNGIYVLFEEGEEGHGGDRIVRVGTHTGDGQLRSRMMQHFVNENKDRSIFRKNIGRALLNKVDDPYLAEWQHDRTSRAGRAKYGDEPDPAKKRAIECDVTKYIQARCRFVVFPDDKSDRLTLESRIISTVSHCHDCGPSDRWLGLSSPKKKICESGLWLVNELYKTPLTQADLQRLGTLLT